jgi:hypothetical protein
LSATLATLSGGAYSGTSANRTDLRDAVELEREEVAAGEIEREYMGGDADRFDDDDEGRLW